MEEEVEQEEAAMCVQAAVRGYQTRRREQMRGHQTRSPAAARAAKKVRFSPGTQPYGEESDEEEHESDGAVPPGYRC